MYTRYNITYCAFLLHLDNFLIVTPMVYVFYMLKKAFFLCFMKRKRIITVHFIEYWVGESVGARINTLSVLIHSSWYEYFSKDMIWLHKYLCYISGYYVGEYADQKLSEFMWNIYILFVRDLLYNIYIEMLVLCNMKILICLRT